MRKPLPRRARWSPAGGSGSRLRRGRFAAMASSENVLKTGDTGLSRPSRWLRERRIRISLSIAVVEGLLVAVHVLWHWAVYALAVLAIAFWVYAGRRYRSAFARPARWIFAALQA